MASGKLKLNSLRPDDRATVEKGIAARKAGKKKTENPFGRIDDRGRREVRPESAKAIWWNLGWEGAYE